MKAILTKDVEAVTYPFPIKKGTEVEIDGTYRSGMHRAIAQINGRPVIFALAEDACEIVGTKKEE